MIERSFAFGAGLVGTICAPDDAGRIGFVLFNAGVVHRVGPFRINVQLARQLAARGIASIRFDLAGLGDSATSALGRGYEAQAVEDLRSAMEALGRAAGLQRFALFGFCSGAYHAYATALAEERVVGVWMHDAYQYTTLKSHLNRYVLRLRERGPASAVWGWAARRTAALARRSRSAEARVVSDVSYIASLPPKADFAAGLTRLLERGVRVRLTYTGGGFERYNYDGQFREAFRASGLAGRAETEFLADADHVLTSGEERKKLVQRIAQWAHELDA